MLVRLETLLDSRPFFMEASDARAVEAPLKERERGFVAAGSEPVELGLAPLPILPPLPAALAIPTELLVVSQFAPEVLPLVPTFVVPSPLLALVFVAPSEYGLENDDSGNPRLSAGAFTKPS
jgi:hypothetical protein